MSLKKSETDLVLGWNVNPSLDPKYWIDSDSSAGGQSSDDLFLIDPSKISNHTAIIAQSGSGKSFFLGRLLEEIIVKTKSNLVIIDPNSDFRRFHEIEDESLWSKAKYDRQLRMGKLPHEARKEDFVNKWPGKDIAVLSTNFSEQKNYEKLSVSLTELSVDFMAEDIDPLLKSDFIHCHKFLNNIDKLIKLSKKMNDKIKDDNLITEAENIFKYAKMYKENFHDFITTQYNLSSLNNNINPKRKAALSTLSSLISHTLEILLGVSLSSSFIEDVIKTKAERTRLIEFANHRIENIINSIARAPNYISETAEHFYFSKTRELEATDLIDASISKEGVNSYLKKRVQIIDLPSLNSKYTRLLALNAILTKEWDKARKNWFESLNKDPNQDNRVPTFIVVDEAHNIIPFETNSSSERAIREQFRTIVSEGRKYGLFLILVTQRPDKLDNMVLSECENKAIMKLSTSNVLKDSKQILNLDDIPEKVLSKTLDFGPGRVLITGGWVSDEPNIFYSASRRTIEGGRNLRSEFWAKAFEQPETTISLPPSKSKSAKKKIPRKK